MAPDHIVFDRGRRPRDPRIADRACFRASTCTRCAFGSAAEYLAYPKPDVPACLILDVELPDINGLELQSRIAQGIIRISCSSPDTGTFRPPFARSRRVRSTSCTKPFKEADLMRAINAALAQNRDAERKRAELAESAAALVDPDAARTGRAPAGRERLAQQTGGGRARDQRGHAPDSSRQHHEEDGCRIARRPRQDGRNARHTGGPLPELARMISRRRTPNARQAR